MSCRRLLEILLLVLLRPPVLHKIYLTFLFSCANLINRAANRSDLFYRDNLGRAANFWVIVFSGKPAAQPEWLQVMSDSEVEISSEQHWSCIAAGKPRPSIRWLRNGQPLTTQVTHKQQATVLQTTKFGPNVQRSCTFPSPEPKSDVNVAFTERICALLN